MCLCLLRDGTKQNLTTGRRLAERNRQKTEEKKEEMKETGRVTKESFTATLKLLMQSNKTPESKGKRRTEEGK